MGFIISSNLGRDPKIPLIHLLPILMNQPMGKIPPSILLPTAPPPTGQVVSREIPSFAVRASCGAFAHGVAKASQKTPEVQRRFFFLKGKVNKKMVDVFFLKKTRADDQQMYFFGACVFAF